VGEWLKVINAQENFWAGEFGDSYTSRNQDKLILASNLRMWSKILERTRGVRRVLELGANVGLNLHAINLLKPETNFTAVEINKKAAQILSDAPFMRRHLSNIVYNKSIMDVIKTEEIESHSLVFTSGVLIHQAPEDLDEIYRYMGRISSRYVMINEYFNPVPMELPYRGHTGKLFKRNFAREFLLENPDFTLIDYGFCSSMDMNFQKDDTTWFLMERI
jgi:pseudaminic acid biosynthesis-associated methylase